jgi:hypothetical protein
MVSALRFVRLVSRSRPTSVIKVEPTSSDSSKVSPAGLGAVQVEVLETFPVFDGGHTFIRTAANVRVYWVDSFRRDCAHQLVRFLVVCLHSS